MKNKDIRQMLKHTDERTERLISEQFPANWDMESAFQKSYRNYLKQKQDQPDAAAERRRLFRRTSARAARTGNDTGFYFHSPTIAACLLLALCTTGTIVFLQQRASKPEQITTVQTDSFENAFTEITAPSTTAPQALNSEIATGKHSTNAVSGTKTAAGTTTLTSTVTASQQTVLTEPEADGSSPSDPAVTVLVEDPNAGTAPLQTGAPSVRQSTATHTTTQRTTTPMRTTPQTTTQTQAPPEPEPGNFEIVDLNRLWKKLVFQPSAGASAEFRKMQFAASAPDCTVTEDLSQNTDAWNNDPQDANTQQFILQFSGYPDITLCRNAYTYSDTTFHSSQYPQMQMIGRKPVCTLIPEDVQEDSTVTIIWEQDASVFSLQVPYSQRDLIYTFIENLESISPT